MKRTLTIDFSPGLLNVWLLVLRVATTAFMLTHGLPKFYKLMQGGEIQFGDPLGLGAVASLSLAVFSEVVCSTFILIGLGTRIATLPLIITMTVAAFVVHADDPFRQKETAILYLILYITLAVLGSGKYSVDQLLAGRLTIKK